jgi:hypothetical protein
MNLMIAKQYVISPNCSLDELGNIYLQINNIINRHLTTDDYDGSFSYENKCIYITGILDKNKMIELNISATYNPETSCLDTLILGTYLSEPKNLKETTKRKTICDGIASEIISMISGLS